MKLTGSKCLVIGGAGFIGGFVVKELLKQDVNQVVIYDNFARGKMANIVESLEDGRCQPVPASCGELSRDTDVLDLAVGGVDYVFHLAAMWLLHCKEFPRTAFHVNIEGTFNVLEACARHRNQEADLLLVRLRVRRCGRRSR